jgi:hypothetical protein
MMKIMRRKVGKCGQKRKKKEATFPAQALSCSGSTGIISAYPSAIWQEGQHPGNL